MIYNFDRSLNELVFTLYAKKNIVKSLGRIALPNQLRVTYLFRGKKSVYLLLF